MKLYNCLVSGCILLLVLIEIVQPTCVLESDFGFKINCAIKKSGLFRVRNLGGVKAHASIGFSLGDELGFEQSLTNLDPSRRRSVSVKNGVPVNLVDTSAPKQEKRGKQNRIMMRPMAPATRPNQATLDKLSSLHRRVSTMQPIIVEAPATLPKVQPTVTQAKPMPMSVPAFKPLPPKEETLKVLPLASKKFSPLQVPQPKGPGLAHQSENYPHSSHDQVSKMVAQMTIHNPLLRITPTPILVSNTPRIFLPTTVTPFVPMPVAAPPTQAISYVPSMPSMYENRPTQLMFQNANPVSNFVDPAPHQIHELASQYAYNTKKVDDYNSITGYGDDTVLKFNKEDINAKIAEIAKAGNISMDAVEAAIAVRQQQILSKYANFAVPQASSTTSTTTSTSTTEAPFFFQQEPEPEIVVVPAPSKPKNRNPTTGKVMNAPREYYPVGYEKNFDDHFQSKVDLPDTTFHCGDQKYFPGLYGDENLGCMVFHVCALTDDGLVLKSFLCPESTLFDQTILKCNWWFYVDCKNTRKLYDTNIPVSKSYQLMKALTFFSSYKKEIQESATTNPEEDSGIKQAISILENQDNKPVQSDIVPNALHIVTPHPIIDERTNHRESNYSSPVYRGNRNYNVSNTSIRRTTTKPKIQDHTTGFKLVNLSVKEDTKNSSLENKLPVNSAETTTEKKETVIEKRHRRRMTLKNSTSGNSSTIRYPTIQTTTKAIEFFAESSTLQPVVVSTASNALVEIMKQEIQSTENLKEVAQEKLNDHIDDLRPIDHTVLEHSANLPQIKRFYRSSAESKDKEIEIVNNEKVQVIRPTSTATLVGEYASPTATIERLDKAVLGKNQRFKKSVISLVTPINNRNRERT